MPPPPPALSRFAAVSDGGGQSVQECSVVAAPETVAAEEISLEHRWYRSASVPPEGPEGPRWVLVGRGHRLVVGQELVQCWSRSASVPPEGPEGPRWVLVERGHRLFVGQELVHHLQAHGVGLDVGCELEGECPDVMLVANLKVLGEA